MSFYSCLLSLFLMFIVKILSEKNLQTLSERQNHTPSLIGGFLIEKWNYYSGQSPYCVQKELQFCCNGSTLSRRHFLLALFRVRLELNPGFMKKWRLNVAKQCVVWLFRREIWIQVFEKSEISNYVKRNNYSAVIRSDSLLEAKF